VPLFNSVNKRCSIIKRWLLIDVAILACLMLVGCGIPQVEYDYAVAEREAVEARIATLESDLSKERSEVSKVKNDLSSVQDEIAKARSDIEAAESEYDAVQSQVSSLKSQISSAQAETSKAKSELVAAEATIAEKEAKMAEIEATIVELETAAEEEEEVEEEMPTLFFPSIIFCSTISGGGNCKPQPNAAYGCGDTVILYFQVGPLRVESSSQGYEIWLTVTGDIYGPGGDKIPSSIFKELHDITSQVQVSCWVYLSHKSKAHDEPGQYRFEVTVIDMLSGATGTTSATFILEYYGVL